MNRHILTAAVSFILGGAATGAMFAYGQPAGPAGHPPMAAGDAAASAAADPPMGPMMGPMMGPGGSAHGPWPGLPREMAERRMEMMRNFSLVYRPDDKALTPDDVKKIAEGFLLWRGNHSWRVINVGASAGAIAFDLATKDGSVIAHFSMDPKTGQLKRLS